jgi:hypothetical protein
MDDLKTKMDDLFYMDTKMLSTLTNKPLFEGMTTSLNKNELLVPNQALVHTLPGQHPPHSENWVIQSCL